MTRSAFATRFEALLGTERVGAILASLGDAPTILLAGDPGTGKSTIAAQVATQLGGAVSGTGALVRAMAITSGMTLAQYNRHLELHPDADVALDAHAAEVIARGEVVVFESRLAGHLGNWLRARGRHGLTSILLRCEPREQACRLIAREASPRLRGEIEPLLAAGPEPRSLGDCLATLRATGFSSAREAIPVLEAQVARTDADRARMLARYGVGIDDPSGYDVVLDTSGLGVTECTARILQTVGITTEMSSAHALPSG